MPELISPQNFCSKNQETLHEKCAVFGVYSKNLPAAELTYYGLYALQHRGQESSGIAVVSKLREVSVYKKLGLVAQVFNDDILKNLPGTVAIGHNRYSTSGGNKSRYVQPISLGEGRVVLSHNGNLPDFTILKKFLRSKKVFIRGKNDSQLMAEALWWYVARGSTAEAAITACYPLFTGAFSLVILIDGELIALRDQCGIRPLVMGELDGATIFASETCALDVIGAKFVRDVQPGEMVRVNAKGIFSVQIAQPKPKFDVFELIYFVRPDSIFFGKSVYTMRKNMGRELAREFLPPADLVVPVPDSAIPAAEGFSEMSGIPLGQVLVKNRYIHRTFIQPTQAMREKALRQKLNLIDSEVRGKRIVVIDDSIVRGTTSKRIVELFTAAGAAAVYFLSCSPPVRYPDFYGIDTPSQKNLIAAFHTLKEINEYIGATGVQYLSYAGLLRAIGVPENILNTSCFTGVYPISIGKRAKEVKKLKSKLKSLHYQTKIDLTVPSKTYPSS